MTFDVTAPTISPTSTPKNDLLAKTFHASEAVDIARKAMQEMAPDPKDYATDTAHQAATRQHAARIQSLESIMRDLHAIASQLDRQ